MEDLMRQELELLNVASFLKVLIPIHSSIHLFPSIDIFESPYMPPRGLQIA